MRGNPLARAGKAEALLGRRLDADPVRGNIERRRDVLPHLRDEARQLRPLREDRAVDVADFIPALAEQRAADIEQLGYDNYLAEIYKLGLSREGYDRVQRASALYQAFYDAYATPGTALYADDDVLHAYAAGAGWITADHILLMTVDPTTREPLDEATVAEKKALAADLLARLRASDDPLATFDALADEYGEDPGRAANPQGYTFTHGTMVEPFDAAARALGENEISDVVESEYGCHIILRRPLDIHAAADAVRETYFEVFFNAETDKTEMTLSPAVDRFDVETVYTALKAAQGAE